MSIDDCKNTLEFWVHVLLQNVVLKKSSKAVSVNAFVLRSKEDFLMKQKFCKMRVPNCKRDLDFKEM